MLQESRAREDAARLRKRVAFTLPATTNKMGHAAPVVGVHPIYDSTVVTVGEDGVICCWNSELKPQKTKDAFVRFQSQKSKKLAEKYKNHVGLLEALMQKLSFK